jgi:large subunit ribosomal protein L21
MSKYAVIRTGGKQYRVSEGDELKIEKIDTEKGKDVNFEDVLLTVDDTKVSIGQPNVKAKVKATVVDHIRDKKISVFKYKAKTGYHKKTGHRQSLTVVKIDKIEI